MNNDSQHTADTTAAASEAWFLRHKRLLIALVIIISTITAISGLWLNLPLESHEVFVARTAEEMIARSDYLVPWINDAPRLKKPPMNYWLVIAVDRIVGSDGDITEWESRAPSALAAIGLSIVVLLLSIRLFDIRTGIIASLLLASSSGYMTYSHSARPEMVYALFCAAGLLALIHADHCRRTQLQCAHAKWFTWLAWFFFALGMLTKGPQLQLPIILGWVVAMLWNRRARDILPVLRPFTGLLIFIALSAWWYYAVYLRIDTATDVWFGETVSRVAERENKPKIRYIDPYYTYRTAVMLLPWVIFYIFALLAPLSRELRSNRASRVLWCVAVAPMILLWFSLNRRWYYMLPVVGPIAVLMAAFALRWADGFFEARKAGWWRNLLIGHILAIAAGAIWLTLEHEQQPSLSIVSTVAVLLAAVCALIACIRISNSDRAGNDRAFVCTILLAAVFITAAAADGALWSRKRDDARASTYLVAEYVERAEPLFGWRDTWETEVYYLDRAIPQLTTADQLLERAPDSEYFWLLVPDDENLLLPDQLHGELIFDVEYARAGGKQLWKISNR